MGPEWIPVVIFFAVVVLVMIRPKQLNQAVPAVGGAMLVVALGYVGIGDIKSVSNIISGAATITLATIMMSAILGRAGFFVWAAQRIAYQAAGSGKRLFWYTLVFSFCMTLFFNNDGSILITTPILIALTKELRMSKRHAFPILLGNALIATSSSAPIGVSNIANLIALKIVGLNLNEYALLMLVPSMAGILVCSLLLYWIFRKSLQFSYVLQSQPRHLFPQPPHPPLHRHLPQHPPERGRLGTLALARPEHDPGLIRLGISTVVVVRVGLFIATGFNIPPGIVAVAGAVFLLMMYALRKPTGFWSIFREVPWHIIVFVSGMYVIVYSLKNIGLTGLLGKVLISLSGSSLFGYILVTGLILTLMSCVMNNLPAVMIGALTLTTLHLPVKAEQLAYLANVMGSDIGSLILPVGTLASLLWFHIVTKTYRVTWLEYMKVSLVAIIPSLLVSLVSLWGWAYLVLK